MMKGGACFETRDGAKLYYEDSGEGRPLLLLHGWLCSSRFWSRNVPDLAKSFRVLTLDLRGHGYSSKVLHGHTVKRYAEDVREFVEALGLEGLVLVGWSLATAVVLAYWKAHSRDSRLRGLGLVDGAVAPRHPGEWNGHGLRGGSPEGMTDRIKRLSEDPAGFAEAFVHSMFKAGKAPAEDFERLVGEVRKTPPWIGASIYSDYVLSDYSEVLPTVPSFVFAADSDFYRRSLKMGEHTASLMKARFLSFDAGHALFLERPEAFNAALAAFIRET